MTQTNLLNSYILQDKRISTALDTVVEIFLDHYREEDGRYHFPTIVGAAAALTGEFSILASGVLSLAPTSNYIMSLDVDNILYADTQKLTVYDLIRLDTDLSDLPYADNHALIYDIADRTAEQFGSDMYPALSLDTPAFPQEWSPNACPRFRPILSPLFDSLHLTAEERALTMALVTGELIALSEDFANKGLSSGLAHKDILVRMAMEIAFGCARIPPLPDEVDGEPESSQITPDGGFKDRIVDGIPVKFAITTDGPLKFYRLLKDGQEYSVLSEPLYDEKRKVGDRTGEIIYLSALSKQQSGSKELEEIFKKLIWQFHNATPDSYLIFD